MFNKVRILFVDDEVLILKGLKNALFIHKENWKMFFAISGEEALKILKDNKIDIIVTDLRMPKMDGLELLKIVKKQYPQIFRIILSGNIDKQIVKKIHETAHHYLHKPCSIKIIKDVIINRIIINTDYEVQAFHLNS